MADMRLVILGAGGRMGRTLVKTIADTPGAAVMGAVEQPGSALIGQDAGVLAGLPANGVTVVPDLKPLLAQAERAPANNRAVMLIGDGCETNPALEFYAWVESIDDVVGKLVCTGCQGDGTSRNVQSYASRPRKCPLCKGSGFLLVGL